MEKELNEEIQDLYLTNVFEIAKNKNVWFMITNYKGIGQYGITRYYDNGYNQANGEETSASADDIQQASHEEK